jgi:flavin-binding protein dodecin
LQVQFITIRQEERMKDNVYKKLELTGTSSKSYEEAVNNALAKAAESVRDMRWFEVTETRGAIDKDHVAQWQVTIKIGFVVEE